jgi:hypothetical protein
MVFTASFAIIIIIIIIIIYIIFEINLIKLKIYVNPITYAEILSLMSFISNEYFINYA